MKPAYEILGVSIRTTAWVCLFAHFLFNLGITLLADSLHARMFLNVEISPILMCANAAWCLLGMSFMVVTSVGIIFSVPFMIRFYYYYGVANATFMFCWFLAFLLYGASCDETKGRELDLVFACMLTDIAVFVYLMLTLAVFVFGIFVLWSLEKLAEEKVFSSALQLSQPWEAAVRMADELADEEARHRAMKGQGSLALAAEVAQMRCRAGPPPPTAGFVTGHRYVGNSP
uniref:Uncharacterized protein n=1 Tax=Noctiluca scintillans TaxID=2966 RepID=A0A7S1A4B8_NOCSC|mmetsp:Transcript_31041/g.82539  ORF Transcript_31041/g.82539 Transcript_31041/m.82539 type:complete len:230 (+) Transcript_31041:71-760(+)